MQTVDFFTPVVDDPYWFGRIAAANASPTSGPWAARPLFALNLVGWPVEEAAAGAARRGPARRRRGRAAGRRSPILGGHSIDDPEPKYGLAVTGLVHPDRILRNVGARPGDRLLLTKPLGTGIASTAIKRGLAVGALQDRGHRGHGGAQPCRRRGAGGERRGARAHRRDRVRPAGPRLGVAEGSRVRLHLMSDAVPVLEGVLELAARDVVPGGSSANLAWVAPHVRFARAHRGAAPAGAGRRPDQRRAPGGGAGGGGGR